MTKHIRPIFLAIIMAGAILYFLQNFRSFTQVAQNSFKSVDVKSSKINLKKADLQIIQLPTINDFQK